MKILNPLRQIAYFVPDVRAAAASHAALFGSGPYLVAEHIPLRLALYRGQPAEFDHSAAYGQWGELMIEFVQQNNPGRSVFHDMYAEGSGKGGMHHVALFVDDVPAALNGYQAAGHDIALYAEMNDGFAFAMVDTVARYGHMIELYSPTAVLTDFYDRVRKMAVGFDGREPIREIAFA